MPLMAGPAVDDAERLPDRPARRCAAWIVAHSPRARPLLGADALSDAG